MNTTFESFSDIFESESSLGMIFKILLVVVVACVIYYIYMWHYKQPISYYNQPTESLPQSYTVQNNCLSNASLTLYYTTKCHNCVNFMSEWEKIKTHYNNKLTCHEHNCETQEGMRICSMANVTGVPSLVYKNKFGKSIHYPDNAMRTKEKICKFIEENS